jgi:hypothetical protein
MDRAQLGCSAPAVLARAKQLGLWKPTSGEEKEPLSPVPQRIILPIAPDRRFPREPLLHPASDTRAIDGWVR